MRESNHSSELLLQRGQSAVLPAARTQNPSHFTQGFSGHALPQLREVLSGSTCLSKGAGTHKEVGPSTADEAQHIVGRLQVVPEANVLVAEHIVSPVYTSEDLQAACAFKSSARHHNKHRHVRQNQQGEQHHKHVLDSHCNNKNGDARDDREIWLLYITICTADTHLYKTKVPADAGCCLPTICALMCYEHLQSLLEAWQQQEKELTWGDCTRPTSSPASIQGRVAVRKWL